MAGITSAVLLWQSAIRGLYVVGIAPIVAKRIALSSPRSGGGNALGRRHWRDDDAGLDAGLARLSPAANSFRHGRFGPPGPRPRMRAEEERGHDGTDVHWSQTGPQVLW